MTHRDHNQNQKFSKRLLTLVIMNQWACQLSWDRMIQLLYSSLSTDELIKSCSISRLSKIEDYFEILKIADDWRLLWKDNHHVSIKALLELKTDFYKSTMKLLSNPNILFADANKNNNLVAKIIWKSLLSYEPKIQKIIDNDSLTIRVNEPIESVLQTLTTYLSNDLTSRILAFTNYYCYTMIELYKICNFDRNSRTMTTNDNTNSNGDAKTNFYHIFANHVDPLLLLQGLNINDLPFLKFIGGQTKNIIYDLIYDFVCLDHTATIDYITFQYISY